MADETPKVGYWRGIWDSIKKDRKEIWVVIVLVSSVFGYNLKDLKINDFLSKDDCCKPVEERVLTLESKMNEVSKEQELSLKLLRDIEISIRK